MGGGTTFGVPGRGTERSGRYSLAVETVGTRIRDHELLAAGGAGDPHTKPFFFPFSSAVTCTNHPLEVDQRRRPCERDGPIGRVLRSCRDSKLVAF
ncbi:hypothetical protein Taro_011316 [Colocasia esculenta]|uniref:Uncharacterized protein n=1 Tax=Colocasia esculenta TaxID=4460 RepID=A0A843UA95_COLES|nr:hypothetical protein [Colocasia esculenta]